MSFSLWWLMRFLQSVGWPRKRGLFRRKLVVAAFVVDSGVARLAHVGCGLGASRPDLAARAIAQSFSNRNWEAEGVGDLLDMFDRTTPSGIEPSDQDSGVSGDSPWKAWAAASVPQAVELAERLGQRDPLRGVVDLKLLDDHRYLVRLDALWASALYFGMTHVADVERFTEAEQRDSSVTASRWTEAGLDIPAGQPRGGMGAFYSDCAAFITAYQAEVQPLPPIPQQLREALVAAGADLNS